MPAPDYATEIAQLEAAAATGELTIEQDGERVTFRSMTDLLASLNYFRTRAASAATPATNQSQFGFSAPGYARD